jgi:tetratricopeptide (TPR) repeat protein
MAHAEHIEKEPNASTGDLEETLFDNLETDPRFQNGVAEASRGDDLDFINMTGLTPMRASAGADETGVNVNDPALNPDAPISFFEEGVGDVDSRMAPDPTSHIPMEDDELVPSSPPPAETESLTVSGLKEIIADLDVNDSPDEVGQLTDSPEPDTEAHDVPQADLDTLTELNLEAASSALDDLGKSLLPETAAVTPPEVEASVPYDFQEAGELIRALEEGEPNEHTNSDDMASGAEGVETSNPAPAPLPPAGDDSDEQDASVYNQPLKKGSSLRKRKRQRLSTRIIQWGTRIVFLLLIAGSAYYMWQLYENRTLGPQELFALAETHIEEGAVNTASAVYADLVRRYPNHPLRSDAEFMEAYALYLTPELATKSDEAYGRSIALFEQFLVDNPGHQKVARAETLLGMLYYRTGRYTDAINRLADPNRRLRDPGSYLPVLRTLARSYAAEGQIEKARSSFLQAAVMESNFEPDRDYLELAKLYMTLAERNGQSAMARRYYSLALEQWNHALRIPGLLVSQRKEIEAARDVLQSRLTLEDDMVSRAETPGQVAAPESSTP